MQVIKGDSQVRWCSMQESIQNPQVTNIDWQVINFSLENLRNLDMQIRIPFNF
ncbi:hypothetical protein [Neobacillus niacini]|uniref:hypothetical protein n=1 Tax=Neobacillus niacini TaxID=86668 RepID=UPI003983016D